MASNDDPSSGLSPLELAPQNLLLRSLPHADLQLLCVDCNVQRFGPGTVLCHTGDAADVVYFPIEGVISSIVELEDGHAIESGMTGSEGVAGLGAYLGMNHSDIRLTGQTRGTALTLRANVLERHLRISPAFERILRRYTGFVMFTVGRSIACARFHNVDHRCARWLLDAHDRAGRDSLQLTQDFIAEMLGVRRASVTTAITQLYDAGLIDIRRGNVRIVGREGLEAYACTCYQALKDRFRELFRP